MNTITHETEKPLQSQGFLDVPKRIRTSDLQFRKLLLYPAELSGQILGTLFIIIIKLTKVNKKIS